MPVTLYQMTIVLDLSKLKAFADNKIDVSEKLKFELGREPAFSLFPTIFSKVFFLKVIERSGLCGIDLNLRMADILL